MARQRRRGTQRDNHRDAPYPMTRRRSGEDTPEVLNRLNRRIREVFENMFPNFREWIQPQILMHPDVPFFYRVEPEQFSPPTPENFETALIIGQEAVTNARDHRVINQPFNSTIDLVQIAHLYVWDFWQEPIDISGSLGASHIVGVARVDYYLRSQQPSYSYWYIFLDETHSNASTQSSNRSNTSNNS